MKNKNLVLLFLLLMVEGGLLSAAAQSKSSVYKLGSWTIESK